MKIKEKQAELEQEKLQAGVKTLAQDEYLKKTANLGQLVEKMQRPWYVKSVQPESEAFLISDKNHNLAECKA